MLRYQDDLGKKVKSDYGLLKKFNHGIANMVGLGGR